MSSASAIPNHLIRTKLYPPRVPERLVRRQQLIEHLNSGRARPVTLISASAGYGKSTLAHQWLEANTDPFAWLSLDKYDSGSDHVLDYLIAALSMVHPELGQETKSLLKRLQLPDPERLADGLLLDLQNLSHTIFLIA
jgi:LuxR family maltose regulon positive regulatory protein